MARNAVGVPFRSPDLTGRPAPAGEQRAGCRYVVENVDLPALLAYRRGARTTPHAPDRPSGTEPAWFAGEDPLLFLTMAARFVRPDAEHLCSDLAEQPPRQHDHRHEAHEAHEAGVTSWGGTS